MPESRTLLLDRETVEGLCRAPQVDDRYSAIASLGLPEAMTVDEISHIGVQVCHYVESVAPSFDAVRNGHRARSKVFSALALNSIVDGDFVTAKSVVESLKDTGRLSDKIEAFVCYLSLRHAIKSSVAKMDEDLSKLD